MQPYGRQRKMHKRHNTDRCGICAEHSDLTDKTKARRQARREIQEQLQELTQTDGN